MKVEYRKTWKNHTGNQEVQPLRICEPENLEDLVHLVKQAESDGVTLRAVGSGHSWSDVALTTGFLVKTHLINRVLELEPQVVRPGRDTSRLVRTQAGIRLRDLNAYLDGRGLALSNMGGYDGQTLAGVVSTSTHGSGISFGPLSDQLCSVDMVAGGGELYRIEPRDGPTDPGAFERLHPDWKLKQDDHWFNAVKVSMGCLGVIYAAMIDALPKFWLKEVRTLSTWPQVKADLQRGDVLRNNQHYEIYFNPYSVGDEHRCLVTTRNTTPAPADPVEDRAGRHPLEELAAALPLVHRILHYLFGHLPEITPEILNDGLAGLVDENYTNLSYKVFNIGEANRLPAYSMEIGVPIDDGSHIKAVELVMKIAEERRKVGQMYHTAPVALRFVKGTDAYLSMMHRRNTMMIELIMLTQTEGGFELLGAHEEALYALSGRPHWGQVNYLTGSHNLVSSMYPAYGKWLEVREMLDPKGTFDSPFTKRTGISKHGFL